MPRLLIVNNSLKDLRGHFFETAVAVAEAARDLGLRPVLGAHVSCPKDLAPEWLEFHPVFTTDHWMVPPLPRLLQLAEHLLPLRWHQPAHRLLRTPWQALNRGRQAVLLRRRPADPLAAGLQRAGIGQEFAFMRRFEEDLRRFLSLCDCQADDHVFLPTAHGRELAAIQRLDLPAEREPTFHLEFRHDLEKFRYQIRHRVFFDHVRSLWNAARMLGNIHLYTDTAELAEEYQAFSGLPFGVLPIPFRARLLREREAHRQICVAYFGDVRDEKGFHWLPDLAAVLCERVRLLVQASLDPTNRNPRSVAALEKLRRMEHVQLIGQHGPLPPDEYYRFVSQTDVLVCPYDATAYRGRSSGTFTEAVAAGVPTVVPANTWMARQQPTGSGEAFTDRAGFTAAVRRICGNIQRYRKAAEKERSGWLAMHSPENLVRTLVSCGCP
jgi:glycosyltransferase involved in cell wall biosynthesis